MKFGFCSGFQWLHGPSVSDFISDLEHSTIFTISKRLGLMWSCNLFITLSNGKYFTFWSWCSIISESSSVRFSQYALLGALRNISICSVHGLKVHTTDYALQGCQCNQLGCAAILFCSTFDIVLTNNDDAWNKDSSIIPFDVNKWIIIYEVPMLLEYWKKTATIHLCPMILSLHGVLSSRKNDPSPSSIFLQFSPSSPSIIIVNMLLFRLNHILPIGGRPELCTVLQL